MLQMDSPGLFIRRPIATTTGRSSGRDYAFDARRCAGVSRYGTGLEEVRAALAAANANAPKGTIESGGRRYQIYTNDQDATPRSIALS